MPTLRIDNQNVSVPAGATILDAARQAGIAIPTLCHMEGSPHFTSCMVCVVKEAASGKIVPSCSALAADGMIIETDSDEIRECRKVALELLLSDHLGDCEGPCHRACPAHMNIPLMIRQIAARRFDDALATVKRDIALPAVLGRICPAPCEGGCRRRQLDGAVSICLLKRFVADVDLAGSAPYTPPAAAASGKRVAVVGAGPTGLAAAYYLAQRGHACTVFDGREAAGGALRTDVPADKLPREVLDAEIAALTRLGVTFRLSTAVGADLPFETVRADHDAAVIAVGGGGGGDSLSVFGVKTGKKGIEVQSGSFATSVPGVFAGGGAVGPCKIAVRAVGHGKEIAFSVDQYLRGEPVQGEPKDFNSVIGKLREAEHARVLTAANERGRVEPGEGEGAGFTADEAVAEAERCLRCDCRKPGACLLRRYAREYGARQSRYKPTERRLFEQITSHPRVVFEQGKCIACGICIRVARQAGEHLGLSFVGRGIATRVGVPFNESFADGLAKAADLCVRGCPTGALSFPEGEDPA